jgi:hypothetical protein
MIKYSSEQRIIARVKNVDRVAWHYVLIKLKNIENYKQMKKDEREKAKIDAKKNLKIKRFRDEVFDKLFFHDFLSRTNEAWLAIWFEQQLMKKQKKNEKMKRIRNAEDAEKVWKAAKEKEKAKKTKSAICYSMFILLLYFVCKNLYSSCSRKRWILFENQCWSRWCSKWSVSSLLMIQSDLKKSKISIRALLCVSFEKTYWIQRTSWIRMSRTFSHDLFSRSINIR